MWAEFKTSLGNYTNGRAAWPCVLWVMHKPNNLILLPVNCTNRNLIWNKIGSKHNGKWNQSRTKMGVGPKTRLNCNQNLDHNAAKIRPKYSQWCQNWQILDKNGKNGTKYFFEIAWFWLHLATDEHINWHNICHCIFWLMSFCRLS